MAKSETPSPPRPEWVSEREIADITGISLSKLRNDRSMGRGFPHYKLNPARQGSVRYKLSEILSLLESKRIEPGR